MLDPDEVADFETWKHDKLIGSTDISVSAYNREMESQALAYEAGVRDAVKQMPGAEASKSTADRLAAEVIADSPYRAKGMRGERRGSTAPVPSTPTTRTTGPTASIPLTDDDDDDEDED